MSLLTILVSCGGDGGDGGGGGDTKGDNKDAGTSTETAEEALCGRICARSSAAKCENDERDCIDECFNQIASTPTACKKSERAFTACAEKAKFTCDENDQAEAKACEEQLFAYATCLDAELGSGETEDGDDAGTSNRDGGATGGDRCGPTSNDDACDSCMKERCCSEVTKCGGDCLAVFDCTTACGADEKCVTGCLEKHAGGVEAFVAFTSCTVKECERACPVGNQ